MEKFEFQKYRDDLAKEIRQEPERQKRREILTNAQNTDEYQEAQKLRQKESLIRQSDNLNERLNNYAQEHCRDYSAFDSGLIELINKIYANKEEFEKETLPNTPNELIYRVISLTEGVQDEQIITLLKRANFDYENLLQNEEDELIQTKTILEVVLKWQSYDEAVEQNKNHEIDFEGFENDPDVTDTKEFVYNAFGPDLLQKCLISKVKYIADKVNVSINGVDYVLPIGVYASWQEEMPEVESRKFRAKSLSLWNIDSDFSKKFISTPIIFYSFFGEKPEKLNYLENVPAEKKMMRYKLGTIAHEVAHHIYDYLMDADKRKDWRTIVDKAGVMTDYAKNYTGDQLKYDEFFTEAVRLKTTAYDYFRVNFPEVDRFLTDNFPEIQSSES